MQKVLVISFSHIKFDTRVKRQISFLEKRYNVSVASYDGLDGFENFALRPTTNYFIYKAVSGLCLLLRRYNYAYHLLYGQNVKWNKEFDLIVANDIEALPLAFQQKGSAKIIFDAHEYAPRHFENKLSWRIFFQGFNKFLCQKYMPKVDGMITIGEG